MSNKSPYEIRLELLQMAKEYMDNMQEMNIRFAQDSFSAAVKANASAAEEWQKFVPVTYTMDDLIKKANEMYGFITKKE